MNTKVSIITPSYNSKRFIKDCIDSVLAQSYRDWEMIIVDDASKDDTVQFITQLIANEPRIKLVTLAQNVGAAQARNKALEQASGRYIAFLDSDDVWTSDKLEKQIAFMQLHNHPFTFATYTPMSEDGNEFYLPSLALKQIDYYGYLGNTIIGCLTVIIDKKQTGEFRMSNIRSSHDMALWLEILKRGFVAHGIAENLGFYRLVGNSNTAKKTKAIKEVWDVYRKIEHFGVVKSAYFWVQYLYHAVDKRVNIRKRVFDIVVSFIGLVFSSPIILSAWVVASLETKSNGMFVQERIGRHGKVFRVYKIKSMRKIAGINTTITASNDMRITKSGAFFRRTKIDELPQLWNVLKGDMSFVGPRPDVRGYADSLIGDDKVVLSIRPGITGPASIKYKNEEDILSLVQNPKQYNDTIIWPDKVAINKKYIYNWSFKDDLKYIIKTIIG